MIRTLFRTLYGLYAMALFALVVFGLFAPFIIGAPTLGMRRAFGRVAVRAWLAASFIPFRVRGRQHLPAGTCVAVCNHASYLDGLLLTAALPPRFTFLVQNRAASWFYVGIIIKRMGVSFVNRWSPREAAQATRELITRVEGGESFAIFPEGTFRATPELMPFQAGAFLIAARAGVPVVPVALRGSRTLFGDDQKLFAPSAISVEFFAPIEAAGDDRHAAHHLRDAARAVILANCGEADGAKRAASAA